MSSRTMRALIPRPKDKMNLNYKPVVLSIPLLVMQELPEMLETQELPETRMLELLPTQMLEIMK